jgi:enoyl-CoA hydratase
MITLETDGPVAIVTLNRPEARNALSSELMRALRSTMAEVGADASIRAVVLTGADPAFCAGLDLKELGSTGENLSVVEQSSDGTARFWEQLSKPVIGAINGVAVTGGLEVALQCDWLVASERAAFGDTHARVGVMPGGGM